MHTDFKGKTSIKNILPVLVPSLSYKDLDIQEGATATVRWNEIVTGAMDGRTAAKLRRALKSRRAHATWGKLGATLPGD